MKCKYKYCKHNNEVEKDVAIKIGNSYYCPDCYSEKKIKQQIEEYYSINMPPVTIQILRKVINQLLYTNNYEAEYILYVLNKIHNNNLKINNPFGLINYCNDGRNIDAWNKEKINKQYKDMKNNIAKENNKNIEVKFEYKSNNKKWSDLI